jgi:trk system potassium uptake protein TrkH
VDVSAPDLLRPVLHIIGILLAILGIGMLIPAAVDANVGNSDGVAFVLGSAITLAAAGGLYLGTRGPVERFDVRQTFLLTTLAWIVLALFGTLPLMMSSLHLRFVDAFYESMSGLSTTGGTVIVGLDHAAPGILLWRALLNWFGGIGIIVMAIAILPVLRVGGMQLFRTESSERDKPFATVQDTAAAISLTYVSLSVLSAILFRAAGMNWFDSICHAMAAVSTGGFSTKDASLGWYDSIPVLWAATVSMIMGAIPLTYYIRLMRNFGGFALADSQVRALMAILIATIGAMTLWAMQVVGLPFVQALSHSAVNVTSIITDTGFVSTDYSTWGSFPLVAFFFFYFIGGCTGSTSGSIKILRERHYDPRVAVRIRRGLEQTAVDYIELIHARAALIREVDAATRDFDLLLMPTVPFVAPRFAELADDAEYGRINMLALRNPSVWNFLDRPAISLPCAGGGLPVGAMLVGRRGHDRRLLAISLGAEPVLAA